ncbi:CaiB/BaiF CoA transferase family protein [Achromobacter denitrificans]|jgi:crotonobetainyl-CoA:carnitine CoA-transferase CaiB-like acyl-CoA transferase|uniref:CaiB/BaiF CoA transferase family protein n=1 Tax=Achromobacter denitrificans TaxID=32002 RepID=UPI0007868749|nr:CoA transferase [Achromobacter denitrificans]MDF3848468.1 CoA transferase [Achromobacter denitrificans]OLU06606.1 CoA transferase [Achromobacter denitrificans]QKH41404.1 CoA transferase [Achromobacter denitrificans]QKH51452.1 CoA transferase [Achromobacter denitrificans]RSE78686.1 CoA transferase [Achromobacter denitrificans]
MSFEESAGPLKGLRILDLSTVVAGPWAATLLADLGADVLKVEIPGVGDPLRALAPHKEGVPLWWKVANRNKKGISVDLRTAEGRDIVARLLPGFDVLVENFRPGTLDGWGMSREWLHEQNPALTILRVTGFGQTGPYRNKPGFARVFEAMSGLTNICGESDGRPLHMGFPIADAVAGLFGALGIVAALYREKVAPRGQGQEIDCSLMESMFRVMDFLPIEYDQLGIVRGRLGNSSQYAAPGNVYRTRDGHWASIAASTQRIFERLCVALELTGVAEDPRYRTNPDRVRNREALDALVADAIARRTLDELAALLDAHAVGFSPIYDIADIFRDPHIAAREGIVSVDDDELGPVRMQSVVPRFSETPGAVHHAGPSLGQHNEEVLGALGYSGAQRAGLRERGVI